MAEAEAGPTKAAGSTEALGASALTKSALAVISPGETPSAAALWAAVGKTRGLVEALLPGLGFLVVYTLTLDVVLSVSAPVIAALAFIIARFLQKSPVLPAITGLVGIAGSAAVALYSGRAEDNFLPGFIVNGVWIAALLVSLLARRPLLGWFAATLVSDEQWRSKPAVKRIGTIATWLWLAMFVARLSVQLHLYFAQAVSSLALAKLVMGVPLYATALWITLLLFRAVYHPDARKAQ